MDRKEATAALKAAFLKRDYGRAMYALCEELIAQLPEPATGDRQEVIAALITCFNRRTFIPEDESALRSAIAMLRQGAVPSVTIPDGLLPETADLVVRFASALADKMYKAQVKYGYDKAEWRRDDWKEICQRSLLEHLAKGDPRDVANYCAFAWHHGWPTMQAAPTPGQEKGK